MTARPHFEAVFNTLKQRRYFKLICGGSFSEPQRLGQLVATYAQTGVTAIDVSADLEVVESAIAALAGLSQPPLLMVSFPLDEDPHFRKIELVEADCILCGACLPVCPTQVFTLSDESPLGVDTPLCYGCGRCVPACPTDALKLDAFSVHPHLKTVLSKPEVTSVEIHTTYADPILIDTLYEDIGTLLEDKLISLCLRPQTLQTPHVVSFIQQLKAHTPYPLIIQVDGEPMSGSDNPVSSMPALEAAKAFARHLPPNCYLTISGGINAYTAEYLRKERYQAIQGVGMGTYARQAIWHETQPEAALAVAAKLVESFVSPALQTPFNGTRSGFEADGEV